MSNYNVNLTDITDTRQVNVSVTTGDKGWSPELVMVRRESDGALVALREWIGGSGEKPTPPQYVAEDGFTDDIEEAVNFKGDKGDKGDKPNHEWIGYSLRFELPNGDWGTAVDLRGEKGDTGEQGFTPYIGDNGNWWIDDQDLGFSPDAYIAINSTSLPTPATSNNFSLVTEGTYTRSGQSNVVVPAGKLGVLSWNGTAWSLSSTVDLPAQPVTGVVEEGNTQAVSGGEVYSKLPKLNALIGNQLFSPDFVVKDKYVNSSGVVLSATGWDYVNIPIEYVSGVQDRISVSGQTMSISTQWVFVDENDVILTNNGAGSVPTMLDVPIPPNAKAYKLTVKRATDGTGYLNSLMINYGSVAKEYEPYKSFLNKINDDELLAKYTYDNGGSPISIDKLIDNKINNNNSGLRVLKSGNNVYIASRFNDTKEIVYNINLYGSQNGASNLLNTKLININEDLLTSGVLIQAQGDAVPPPFQVNVLPSESGYLNIGGNHGLQTITDAVSNSHGKSADDLLSVWKDVNDYEFYLVEILSANSLRFASKPFNISGFDKISPTPYVTLTHVSGAVNTSNINISGNSYEYKPCINSIDVKLFLDDLELTNDGTYYGKELTVIDNHNVVDPTLPTLTIPYLPQNNGTMVKNTLVHTFYGNGSYTVENIADFQKNHEITNVGIIQPQVINKGTYSSIKTYAMNVGSVSGLDFQNGFDMSLLTANTFVKKADFINQEKSVQQLSEILFSGSNPVIGCGFGYNPLVGTGTQEELLQNENHLLMYGNSKKYYPFAYNLRESENKIIRGIGYYAYWDATVNPNLSADYFVPFGDSFLYFLNLRTASTKLRVTLSKELLLKEFEVVNSSDNIVLHTENSTTSEGLIVSGSVGDWCILKIR